MFLNQLVCSDTAAEVPEDPHRLSEDLEEELSPDHFSSMRKWNPLISPTNISNHQVLERTQVTLLKMIVTLVSVTLTADFSN